MKTPGRPPPGAGTESQDAREVREELEAALAEVVDLREAAIAREAELNALSARTVEQERELIRLREDSAVLVAYRDLARARGTVIEELMREVARRPGSGPRRAAPRMPSRTKKSAS